MHHQNDATMLRPNIEKATPRRNVATTRRQNVAETATLRHHLRDANDRVPVRLRVAKTCDDRRHATRVLLEDGLQVLKKNCRSKIGSDLSRKPIRRRIESRGRRLGMENREKRVSAENIGEERAPERLNETQKAETAARKGNSRF